MKVILLAVGFMLIFEGLMPLISPSAWVESLRRIAALPEQTIRRIAFGVISAGLIIVWAIMEMM